MQELQRDRIMKVLCYGCDSVMALLDREGTNDQQQVAHFVCIDCDVEVKVITDNAESVRT